MTSQTYFFRFISKVWHIFLDSLCCAFVLTGICFSLQMKYILHIHICTCDAYICLYLYIYLLTLAHVGGESFCNQVFCLCVWLLWLIDLLINHWILKILLIIDCKSVISIMLIILKDILFNHVTANNVQYISDKKPFWSLNGRSILH